MTRVLTSRPRWRSAHSVQGLTTFTSRVVKSRTFLVKVGLPKGENVYTGMFGRLVLPAGQRDRVLVPRAAVQRVGQLTFVTVVGPERHVSRRLVTLGPQAGPDHLEVLSGLRPGDVVLLHPGEEAATR